MNSKGNCTLLDLPILWALSLILTSAILGSERGNKEMQLADVLSPTSKKKTGRAYVALARAHSEKYVSSLCLTLSTFLMLLFFPRTGVISK